ncbi:mucosa-associated lymphoid tissue lymphoma translocation protein 1-like isoform X2 [Battus philenor]|uniref:mucosa-associated lymphoid tissue lymphoma translocation protein 1-like isoform X2 n=1 Tax=Battus philenor TaxID=42288 RepID=UPI0035CEAB10
MSLLQKLSYTEYQKALTLNIELCEVISKLAELKVIFNENKTPGEVLMKALDRRGYSVHQYKQLLTTALNTKTVSTFYRPHSKVAILIGNDKYKYLSKLVTPSIDCDSLALNLKNLGFIIIILKNMNSSDLKSALSIIFRKVPEDSYCFIFYAGHGCELCNTKCMLGLDCPTEDITIDDCVTENWLLREVSVCKPELCVLILDMCRINLDRTINPKIYAAMVTVEDYTIHGNLLLCYSTQSSEAAYELLQIECSTTIDGTYEVKTGDTEKIMPGASLYVNALCTRLMENLDVNSLLDKIHGGNVEVILNKLKEVLEKYRENCTVF